jgi:hypothetical protein
MGGCSKNEQREHGLGSKTKQQPKGCKKTDLVSALQPTTRSCVPFHSSSDGLDQDQEQNPACPKGTVVLRIAVQCEPGWGGVIGRELLCFWNQYIYSVRQKKFQGGSFENN